MRPDWNSRWMDMAAEIGGWSKDRSRGVGCVIIGHVNQMLSSGYNGFPRGVDDGVEARHDRPAKYTWTEHAERNAIFNAARTGVPLQGATMYCTLFPCAPCARAIVQSGIGKLVSVAPDMGDAKWAEDFRVAQEMLTEAGVHIDWHHEDMVAPSWRAGLPIPIQWAGLDGG